MPGQADTGPVTLNRSLFRRRHAGRQSTSSESLRGRLRGHAPATRCSASTNVKIESLQSRSGSGGGWVADGSSGCVPQPPSGGVIRGTVQSGGNVATGNVGVLGSKGRPRMSYSGDRARTQSNTSGSTAAVHVGSVAMKMTEPPGRPASTSSSSRATTAAATPTPSSPTAPAAAATPTTRRRCRRLPALRCRRMSERRDRERSLVREHRRGRGDPCPSSGLLVVGVQRGEPARRGFGPLSG